MKKFNKILMLVLSAFLLVMMLGCSPDGGNTDPEKQAKIEEMDSWIVELDNDIVTMKANGYPEDDMIEVFESQVEQLDIMVDSMKLSIHQMTNDELDIIYRSCQNLYETLKTLFSDYL